MGKNARSTLNAQTTINMLKNLHPGDRITYYTGLTGWLEGKIEHQSLLRWCLDAQNSGEYIFVQRKKEHYERITASKVFIYDYIAIRRKKPIRKTSFTDISAHTALK